MPIVPKGRGKRLAFYESRVAGWTAHAESLGVSAELIAELQQITAAARQAFKEQRAAQQTARSATLRFQPHLPRAATHRLGRHGADPNPVAKHG